MFTITLDAETKLNELLIGLRDNSYDHYAIHFYLSKLQEHYKSACQIKIAVNIISNLFKSHEGAIFLCENSDIIVIYKGKDKQQLEKVIFQLRYLFVDDPLAYSKPGKNNPDFCSVYDLEFQFDEFYKIGKKHYIEHSENSFIEDMVKKGQLVSLQPNHLVNLEKDLRNADITPYLRQQSICFYNGNDKDIKPIFEEMYVSIMSLRQSLLANVDLLSNKNLFKYLTTILDQRVLAALISKGNNYIRYPVSINLNVSTLFSEDFMHFDSMLKPSMKSSIVIEINISDVFDDINAYKTAQKSLQRQGYRICLDGLNIFSLQQINRESMGFNLAKLLWNAEDIVDVEKDKNNIIKKAVEKCGKKRLILCRCDSRKAIDYGMALGISLFQGRYLDKIINPNSKVTN